MRAVSAGLQPAPVSADRVGVAGPAFAGAGSDYSGGVCVAASRDFGGADAVWIGYFLHRVCADAVGSRIGYDVLRRWHRFFSLCFGAFNSLLRYAA